ncbi:uncharacterized protein LOC107365448 [Tetranychus urticae]|uniref:Uncharacterized protein n=1 Tax=Tetranychus urticae TaxID=32264 RepID=T1KN56_TETUR|nr:uncharacterized protein LOC107365448 [Tetranychus urticae]
MGGMDKNSDNSDKTIFKVKFLGEYHDVVIDWSDESHEYKQVQLFKQLESITGIANKYICQVDLEADNQDPFLTENPDSEYFYSIVLPNDFTKDRIYNQYIHDDEILVLRYHPVYDSRRVDNYLFCYYELTNENMIREGVCSMYGRYCPHLQSKTVFNKVKYVFSDEFQSKIIDRIGSSNSSPVERFLMEFNVQQYFRFICTETLRRWPMRFRQRFALYLRNRG